MELVKKASQYIYENAGKVISTYRSKFHMEPTVGWMNDPNGLICLDGEFHLFYQANPFSAKNEKMAWGHFISRDLVKYKEVDIALYPDVTNEETGCFSGSAFIEDGKMKLVYTKHLDMPGTCKENQHIVNTNDKIKFVKEEKPCVDPNELPENIAKNEFRDPQIFFYEGKCYLIVGGRTIDHKGVFLVFSGIDSSSLHFDFYFGPNERTYRMVECPSFIRLGGKDVIIYSVYGLEKVFLGRNINHKVFYLVGKFKPEAKTFDIEHIGEIDEGDAFYAPKTIENYEIPTLVGWMENWNKDYLTKAHEWAGSFTFPRVLSLKNNELYQDIHPVIKNYAFNRRNVENHGKISKFSLNEFSFKNNFSLLIKAVDGSMRIYNDGNKIRLDMLHSNNLNESIFETNFSYNNTNVKFLLDTSSIEVFVDNGHETITSRHFLSGDVFEVEFDGVTNLITEDIEVK